MGRSPGHHPGMDDRDDRVRSDRGTGPALLRPNERHSTRPVPYPDDTRRARVGYGGDKASRVVRQQREHPSVSRLGRQRHVVHEYIGVFHEPRPFRAVRVHPQEHIARKRAGRVPAGERVRIPSRGRGQRIGSHESRTVGRIRTPDDKERPVVQAVTAAYRIGHPTGPFRTEAHRGPRGVRLRDRAPVAHSAAPLWAGISHRVSDGGDWGGATNGGRAGSPSPSMR